MYILFEKSFYFIFILSGFQAFYSIGLVIKTLFKIGIKDHDELESKVIVESLAITILIVFLVSLGQSFLAIKASPEIYPFVLLPGFGSINQYNSIEPFMFYTILFSLVYNFRRYKYALTGKALAIISTLLSFSLISIVFI